MIKLTRLNGQAVVINIDCIKFVEATPDTKITFLSNDMLLVRESVDEVVNKTNAYKKEILSSVNYEKFVKE